MANFTLSDLLEPLAGMLSTDLVLSGFISVGTTPSLTGTLRLPYTGTINWRNANNTGDLPALDFTGAAGAERLLVGFGDIFEVSLSATNAVTCIADYDVTGNQTLSGFLAIGATPAVAGTLRFSNVDSIAFRNNSNAFDLNILSSPMSDEFDFGDALMPIMRHQASSTQVKDLRVLGVANAELTEITRSSQAVSTPSGQTATATNLIPAGCLLIGITTRVETTITGPAGFDVGDGLDVDRWGNSLLPGAGQSSRGTDFTSNTVQIFPTATSVVITSDGVDFTGGVVRVTAQYIQFTAPSI